MDTVRLGLIGCGAIGAYHASTFARIDGLTFAAAADRNAGRVAAVVGDRAGVARFADGHEMIRSGAVDAVLVAVPHFAHPPLAIAALNAGLHVLTEKPVAVTALEAERVNAVAATRPDLRFAVMYNQRGWPIWRKVRDLIDAGAVGPLRRVSWTITDWFRTQAYYDKGEWRGTWAGEGGGVLVNQCPHQLDLLQWFCGMPRRVTAVVGVGKHHRVEVEDEVTALLEFPPDPADPPDPAALAPVGVFVTGTGESPGVNRLELVGDRGTIVVDRKDAVRFWANATPTGEYVRTSPDATTDARVPFEATTFRVEPVRKGHEVIVANFVRSILRGDALIAPGAEGIRGVELANAMLMSGLTGRPVDLPTDRPAFAAMLDRLTRGDRPTTG